MDLETYFAHSSPNPDMTDWETCPVHLRDVGDMAGGFADKFGAGRLAMLTGQLHDLGKCTREFQQYIRGERARGPDHSTAGAREIIGLASAAQDRLFAHVAAYAIAGHHAGLPDHGLEDGCLQGRLARADLPALFSGWRDAVTAGTTQLAPEGFNWRKDKKRPAFQMAFLGRMLFSCLVDADRLCTEAYRARVEGRGPVDREWPQLPEIVGDLVAAFDAHMAGKAASMPEAARASPLNLLRNDILAQARDKATLPKGVFTLDVPTGGGKTLSSLAFALEHARRHGMDRIVYGIPFTSIVEQTAGIMRAVFGDGDSQRVVLEHHSGFDGASAPEEGARGADFEGANKLRLAMENWAAPLVVTTNVQLFESLFSARPARCRKLHNLCNSVIILDEAQSIPLNLLRPCVAALDELVRNYGCTVVLCTATQPALLEPEFPGGFEHVTELAPDPDALHATLKRVTPRLRGVLTDADLVRELGESPQGLVIVNSRVHARALYLAAVEAGLEGVIHLTTRQTAADRRRILAHVRRRLKAGEPCRVIATSLIEAGVDVSFPRVWRAETGLDSIIQAAGRCNREGERPASESFVDVFTPAEVKTLPAIQQLAAAFGRAASERTDFFARDVITLYFREVYWGKGEGLDQVKVVDGGKAAVADLFGVSAGQPAFSYKTCSEAFRFIEDGMAPVIIAQADEPRKAIAALLSGAPVGREARKLQAWIVQIPPRYRKLLIENGHARFLEGFGEQFALLTRDDLYSPEQGLVWEQADSMGLEQYIF